MTPRLRGLDMVRGIPGPYVIDKVATKDAMFHCSMRVNLS